VADLIPASDRLPTPAKCGSTWFLIRASDAVYIGGSKIATLAIGYSAQISIRKATEDRAAIFHADCRIIIHVVGRGVAFGVFNSVSPTMGHKGLHSHLARVETSLLVILGKS
jgi:hypothetical protein